MDLDKLFIEHRKLLERVEALEGGTAPAPHPPAPANDPPPVGVPQSAFDDLVKRTEQEIARLEERLAGIDAQLVSLGSLYTKPAEPAEPEEEEPEDEPPPHRRPGPRARR